MSKNYCIFSAQYLPHLGGIERYTYNIAKELIKSGNNVTIVTNNTTNSPTLEIVEGISIYRFPCLPLIDGRFPIPEFTKTFRNICSMLDSKSFDAVIINARFYIHSLYAARFAQKHNYPCICIDHGTSHLSIHNTFLDFLGSVYEHMHTSVLKHFCKNYYGVSEACCHWLEHFHITPKGVLYNAVDLEEIDNIKNNTTSNYRDKYHIPKNEIIITFTGRLLKEKGIYELIEAIERINSGSPKVHLMLAGDGPESSYVSHHASAYIHQLGKIPFENIINLLEESDIFCLPSFSEGFSTSALEAAACNCFIITTKRGGTKELVMNSKYGIVIDDNHPDKIYSALQKAISDNELRTNGCQLCYERLKNNFTWEKTAKNLENIFDYKTS